VATLLKAEGINPTVKEDGGIEPVHVAARYRYSMKASLNVQFLRDGSPEALKLLVEDSRVDLNVQKTDGWTPLHLCVGNDEVECVKVLLGQSALEVNLTDKNGFTPLHLATWEVKN